MESPRTKRAGQCWGTVALLLVLTLGLVAWVVGTWQWWGLGGSFGVFP